MLRGPIRTHRGSPHCWHARLLLLACLVIACVGRAEDLEVHSVCNVQEKTPPYNYELCRDSTGIPFPVSTAITDAKWISKQFTPAPTSGDHLQTTWAPDGNAYVAFDDEISGSHLYSYVAKVSGIPPNLTFTRRGSLDPVGLYPIGLGLYPAGRIRHYYMEGMTSVNGALYATRWPYQAGPPLNPAPYWANTIYPYGIDGIAYSLNAGVTWILPPTDRAGYTLPSRRFGPHIDQSGKVVKAPANLVFVQYGRDAVNPASRGNVNPDDGYIYATFQERERNADNIFLGAVNPTSPNDVVNPTKWIWYKGAGQWTTPGAYRVNEARPIISWAGKQTVDDSGGHFSYPEMHYDKAIGRYLLTFSYAYNTRASCTPAPPAPCAHYAKNNPEHPSYSNDGGELVILESPKPWGPFSFVARAKYFGPGNGYSIGIPPVWQGPVRAGTQDVWMKWAANYARCTKKVTSHVVCKSTANYTLNLRELRFTLASTRAR